MTVGGQYGQLMVIYGLLPCVYVVDDFRSLLLTVAEETRPSGRSTDFSERSDLPSQSIQPSPDHLPAQRGGEGGVESGIIIFKKLSSG